MRVIFPGHGIEGVVSLRPLAVSRGLPRLPVLKFGVSVCLLQLSVCPSHFFLNKYFFVPCTEVKFGSGRHYLGKEQQPQEQRYSLLSVYAVFSCVSPKKMVWLPVFGIFNVRTDVNACDCTREAVPHQSAALPESRLNPHRY